MRKMNDLQKMYAPFGRDLRRRKTAYCNNKVIPLLKRYKIKWEMSVEDNYIKFGGRRFVIATIDDGRAERFIQELIVMGGDDVPRQSVLDEYMG